MSIAFMFPGQGSQLIGMGLDFSKHFQVAKEILQEMEDTLCLPFSKLMFEGPLETLTLTENAQVALLTVSMMACRVLEQETGQKLSALGQYVIGHSLGEYSALCAANYVSFPDAVKIVRARGQSMQSAVPVGVGGMAAILGLEIDVIHEILESDKNNQVCVIANDNCPGQVVISGHMEQLQESLEKCQKAGAKRAILLQVSAPFHSPLMQPAALVVKEVLDQVPFLNGSLPIMLNVTAQESSDVHEIKTALVNQVCGRVRFREGILALHEKGVNHFIELGSGKVLSQLVKRIVPTATTDSLQESQDLKRLFERLIAA